MADSSRSWSTPSAGAGQAALAQPGSTIAPVARQALALAATAAAASWIGFYLITELPFLELETFRATITLHLVTGIVLIPYLVSLIAWRRLPGGSALDVPLLLLIAVYLLATAASVNWRVSLEVTLTVLLAVGVFAVLSDGRFLSRPQVEAAFMLAVLAAAVRGIWLAGEDYVDWLRLSDAVRGGFALVPPTVPKLHNVGDHPNLLGGIMAASLPFFLVLPLRRAPAALRAAGVLAIAVLLLAIFLSLARSAWLAAAAGTATAALLLAAGTPGGRALLRRLWPTTPGRQVLAGAVALLLAAGVLGAAYVAQSTDARPLWLFRESGTPRLDVMGAGAEMVQDYPLLGAGPGSYGLLYPEYSGRYPNHAFHSHNGFLQAAVDLGVPGVLAMLLLAGTLAWLLLRALRTAEGETRLSVIAVSGAFAGFATFSLLDAPNMFKGPLVALACLGAIATLAARDAPAPPEAAPAALDERWLRALRAAQLVARAAVPVALAALLVGWGRLDVAHYEYSNARENANAGNLAEAGRDAQRAVDLDPSFPVYRLALGTILGQAYLKGGQPELLEDAERQLERAVELEPRSAVGYTNLALLYAQAADRERTLAAAQQALRYANSDAAVMFAAGSALEATNWGDEAVEAYARALFLDAGLADSPFWEETAFRRTRYPDIIAGSALIFNPCVLLRLAIDGAPEGPISRGEAFDLCTQQVAANPGALDARVALATAQIAQGEFDAARGHLDYVLDRQPDNGAARTALGRWHGAHGDTARAREEWLLATQLEDVGGLVLLGDSYPPG
ncbi:MAG: O-antigen ligase family protein, partial [Chloroflexi bacterium]|nr:O-antigen ligase family protein [Chloroflexota bacterium]